MRRFLPSDDWALLKVAVAANAGRFEWKGGGNNWGEIAKGLLA